MLDCQENDNEMELEHKIFIGNQHLQRKGEDVDLGIGRSQTTVDCQQALANQTRNS